MTKDFFFIGKVRLNYFVNIYFWCRIPDTPDCAALQLKAEQSAASCGTLAPLFLTSLQVPVLTSAVVLVKICVCYL
jgi:hypothetical protein